MNQNTFFLIINGFNFKEVTFYYKKFINRNLHFIKKKMIVMKEKIINHCV